MPSGSFKFLLLAAPVLLLAACDGEPTRVSGVVPYTMERTAGTGVAYVRAKMMPEKSLVLETTTAQPAEPVGPPAPPVEPVTKPDEVKTMEPVFHEKQQK